MPRHVYHCDTEVKSIFPSHNKCNKIIPPSSITGRIVNNYAMTKGCTSLCLDEDKKYRVCSNLSNEIFKYQKERYGNITTPKITPPDQHSEVVPDLKRRCSPRLAEREKEEVPPPAKKKLAMETRTHRHHTRSQPNPFIRDINKLKVLFVSIKKKN